MGVAAILAGLGPTAGAEAMFRGLGDLPGGGFGSNAFGVSADGSIVVGVGSSAAGNQAFRWTAAGGMVGLGDLPGGNFDSRANGVSADGAAGTKDDIVLTDGGFTQLPEGYRPAF